MVKGSTNHSLGGATSSIDVLRCSFCVHQCSEFRVVKKRFLEYPVISDPQKPGIQDELVKICQNESESPTQPFSPRKERTEILGEHSHAGI